MFSAAVVFWYLWSSRFLTGHFSVQTVSGGEAASSSSKKRYDLGPEDKFWTDYGIASFTKVSGLEMYLDRDAVSARCAMP